MNSQYASPLLRNKIWPDFAEHFKSKSTQASYLSDISEFMDYWKKDFLDMQKSDVEGYFAYLKKRVEKKEIKPGTMAKKFRELHSFSAFICENKVAYQMGEEYQDYYVPLLKYVAKQERLARSVPVEDIDLLLHAAKADIMAYAIITLMYRAGLSSTEITSLKKEDFAAYENGVYASVGNRREPVFIPEDAVAVLDEYLCERGENEHLFYNRSGRKLNLMYISRMMKKYTKKAGIESYSAESIRNSCGFTMFAYGADGQQVAAQMGVTPIQIQRYKGVVYRSNLQQKANALVRISVAPPV